MRLKKPFKIGYLMQTEYYPWHQNIWMQWQQLLSQSRMHHGILLNVAEGSGGDQLVLLLAKLCSVRNQRLRLVGFVKAANSSRLVRIRFHHVQPEAAGNRLGLICSSSLSESFEYICTGWISRDYD